MKISTELRYGALLGMAFCLYTVLMWLTRLDTTYLSVGNYLDIAVIILPLGFTFLGIRAKAKEVRMTLFRRMRCGVVTNLIAYSIYTPFLLIYHRFINPDWLRFVLDLKEKDMLAKGVGSEQIEISLENIQSMGSESNLIINGLVAGVVVLGIAFSLLSLPFFRSKIEEIT